MPWTDWTRKPFGQALLVAAFALALASFPGLLGRADYVRQLSSAHFLLTYTVGGGADAVTSEYAGWVRDALEAAYQVLIVADGFSAPAGPIETNIVAKEGGEMGAEYITYDSTGEPHPVIEMATQTTMEETLAELTVPCSLEDALASTAAHELFHVIQDTLAQAGKNDMSDLSFVEALATWAQEEVAPQANDYLDPSLDFLLGPDSLSFFHRTYDAGIFWVFVTARHGGAEAIRRVMTASTEFDGRYAVDAAFQGEGLSFLDLWEEFSVALATEAVPDADRIRTLFPIADTEAKSQRGKGWAELPPPVYQGTWSGEDLLIDRVNSKTEAPYAPEFAEDPLDAPLRVAHAYGIDLLHLVASADRPLEISFSGGAGTEFRVNVAGRRGAEYSVWRLAPGETVRIENPDRYAEIRIVVTRGEAGNGTYQLTVREAALGVRS